MLIEHGPAARFDIDTIIEGLNASFGTWGDRRLFAWAFERVVAGLPPDIVLARDGGAVIGSLAVAYRHVVTDGGELRKLGIIGGAWTSPAARGRGVFSTLVREAQEISAARGVPHVIAFVRHDNHSRKTFESAGARMVPAWYCRSTVSRTDPQRLDVMEPRREMFPPPAGLAHFVYSDEEWIGQFVDRPSPVECVGRRGEWCALVERGEGFDRLLAIGAITPAVELVAVDALTANAHARGQRLFVYTLDAAIVPQLEARAFESIPGFMPCLPPTVFTRWQVQGGDRA